MPKIKLVQQAEHSECGLASLTMLLHYNKRFLTLAELRTIYGVPRGGFKLSDMVKILEDYGLQAKAFKTTSELQQLMTPCIAYWNDNHYLVIEKVTKKRVLICDPATGRRWIPMDEAQLKFSNVVINVVADKGYNATKTEKKRHFLRVLIEQHFNRPLIYLLLLTMGLQLFTLIIPDATRRLIDQSFTLANGNMSVIIVASILLMIGYYSLQVSRGFIVAKFQKIFDDKLMSYYMEKLLKLPLHFFTNRSTGELIFRSNLSVYIRQVLTQKAVLLVVDSIFLTFYIALMWHYTPILTTVTVGIAVVMISISVMNTRKIKHFVDLEMIEQAKVQKGITEMIEGIETVKSTGTELTFMQRWHEDFYKQLSITQAKERFAAIFITIPQTLQFALPILLLVIGLYFVQQQMLTIGTVVAFLTLASSFITPVMSLTSVYNDFVLLQSYFEKIEEIINHPVPDEGSYETSSFEALSLNNVSYQYSRFDEPVIRNVDLSIRKGEKVAIVGASGSGKSTLLKMMAGLVEPSEGNLYFNDVLLRDISKEKFHKQVAYTNQHAAIFNDTIKNNIVLNQDFDYQNQHQTAHLGDVLQKSDVLSIIRDLPLNVESMLSEQGANLSGGQKQKIALARSLYKKPALHLLDEPTSALDNVSERHVMKAILSEEATCVIVAHRLQTIKQVDRIIVVSGGQIVGEGTHEQLMKHNYYYKQLYMEEKKMEDAS